MYMCSWVTESSKRGRYRRQDGSQEIRPFKHYGVIDYNGLQISGAIDCIMPQNIAENYLSDGWDVLEIDGHDYNELYRALTNGEIERRPRMHHCPHRNGEGHTLYGE